MPFIQAHKGFTAERRPQPNLFAPGKTFSGANAEEEQEEEDREQLQMQKPQTSLTPLQTQPQEPHHQYSATTLNTTVMADTKTYPIRAFRDTTVLSVSTNHESPFPLTVDGGMSTRTVELGTHVLGSFPNRIPRSRIEAATLNRVLDRLLKKLRSNRTDVAHKANHIGFAIPAKETVVTRGIAGLQMDMSDQAHDMVLADLLHQAAKKARRFEGHLTQHARNEQRLEAALAASEAECREKERKLLLRALEKKELSNQLHQLMESMSPDMNESLLSGKSVADMMQDLKARTMQMHDDDLARMEAMERQRNGIEENLKKVRDSLEAEHEMFERLKLENQRHIEEANEMAAQAKSRALEAQRIKAESKKALADERTRDKNVLLWVRAGHKVREDDGLNNVGPKDDTRSALRLSQVSTQPSQAGTSSAIQQKLQEKSLHDTSLAVSGNQDGASSGEDACAAAWSAATEAYLDLANKILKRCNEPHAPGKACELQIVDPVGDLMDGRVLVRLLNYKFQEEDEFNPDEYDKSILLIEDLDDKERFCAAVGKISGFHRGLGAEIYRMANGPEKRFMMMSVIGAAILFGPRFIDAPKELAEAPEESEDRFPLSSEPRFPTEVPGKQADTKKRSMGSSKQRKERSSDESQLNKNRNKYRGKKRPKTKKVTNVTIDGLVWKSKVSVQDKKPEKLDQIKTAIAEIYAERLKLERVATSSPLPLATFTRQWFLRQHGIRTMADSKLAILALGLVAYPEEPRLRAFAKLAGVNPDNYKKHRAHPANLSILHHASTCTFFINLMQDIFNMLPNNKRMVGPDDIFAPLDYLFKAMKKWFIFSAKSDRISRVERIMERHAKENPRDPITDALQVNVDLALEELLGLWPFECQEKHDMQSYKVAVFLQSWKRGVRVRKDISLRVIESQLREQRNVEISHLRELMAKQFSGCGESFETFSKLCSVLVPDMDNGSVVTLFEKAHDLSADGDELHKDLFTAEGFKAALTVANYILHSEKKVYVLDNPESGHESLPPLSPLPLEIPSPKNGETTAIAVRRNSVFGDVWSSPQRRMDVLRNMSSREVKTIKKGQRAADGAINEGSDSDSDSDSDG